MIHADSKQQDAQERLAFGLRAINNLDQPDFYGTRNQLVIHCVYLALTCGWEAGFRFDPAEPEYPVAFIELPTGQVSWHLPQHVKPWDSHTTEEKYRRVVEFCNRIYPGRGEMAG